jgi:hypothetical protein
MRTPLGWAAHPYYGLLDSINVRAFQPPLQASTVSAPPEIAPPRAMVLRQLARTTYALNNHQPSHQERHYNLRYTTRMSGYRKLPQKVWDEITSYLSPFEALRAAETLDFRLTAYDKVWTTIFKSDRWHESPSAENAQIILIGADLDILGDKNINSARPSVVLTAFDCAGDLQYENDLLRSSFRGAYNGPGEYQLEHASILISSFDSSEVFGRNFHYLFSKNNHRLQTKYCYWKDPKKKIRTASGQDIRGIGGAITTVEDLDPIFLLNLRPPVPCIPDYFPSRPVGTIMTEQHTFRSFWGSRFGNGNTHLVEPMYEDRVDSGEYFLYGFSLREKNSIQ